MSSMIHRKKSNPWPTIIFILVVAGAWYLFSSGDESAPTSETTQEVSQTATETAPVAPIVEKPAPATAPVTPAPVVTKLVVEPSTVESSVSEIALPETVTAEVAAPASADIDALFTAVVEQNPPLYSRFGEVRTALQKAIFASQDKVALETLLERLNRVNDYLLYHANGAEFEKYTVVPGDSLGKIGKRFGHDHGLIMKVNRLNSTNIRIGQKLRIPKGKPHIIIIKQQYKLYLMLGEQIFQHYSIGLGKMNSTPEGSFVVTTKLIDPEWTYEGKVIPGGAPDNELGTRWIGISEKGYGIHGTLYPETIGSSASRGCVRMVNADVEKLFVMIPRKSSVVIR